MIHIEDLRAEKAALLATLRLDDDRKVLEASVEELRAELQARGLTPINRIMLDDVAKPIADAYGVTIADLKGSIRSRKFTIPRQHFMWMARRVTTESGAHRWSTPQIGRYLGGRDHTTVLHGISAHQARMETGENVVLPYFDFLAKEAA